MEQPHGAGGRQGYFIVYGEREGSSLEEMQLVHFSDGALFSDGAPLSDGALRMVRLGEAVFETMLRPQRFFLTHDRQAVLFGSEVEGFALYPLLLPINLDEEGR